MPLLVGSGAVTPTPPTAPTWPVPVDPGEYVPSWIDPDGIEWALNPPGNQLFTMNAVTGYGITPVEIKTKPKPRGGVRVQGVRPLQRTLVWPVRLRGNTHMEFLAKWRAYGVAFAKTRRLGPGLFRLTRPDGTAREVLAWYQSGWEGTPGQGQTFDTPELNLLVPDGFWRDAQQVVVSRSYGASVDYLAPFPSLSSGEVLGDTEITNPGEVEAWPTWRIDGPATQVVAVNHTLGKQFTVVHNLLAGEHIDITTDPGRVTGPSGDMPGALQRPGSTLWRLEPGVNDITFTVSGSGAGTKITLSFYPRYETA
jgi:hypothetical protein